MKQRSSKNLWETFHCYSNAKPTLLVPLTFNRFEKTKLKRFIFVQLLSSSFFFFFFFFLSFFFHKNNSKSIRYLRTINIYMYWTALLTFYLFWALCELQVASYSLKTVPKSLRVFMSTLLGFSRNNYVGVASMVRPHMDYWACAVQANRTVRKRSFVVFSINLIFTKGV